MEALWTKIVLSTLAGAPVYVNVLAIAALSAFLSYKHILKPKVRKETLKDGLTINESRMINAETIKWSSEINGIRHELEKEQLEYIDTELDSFRYRLRDTYQVRLEEMMEEFKCPSSGQSCGLRGLLIETSVGTYIGLLQTVTKEVYKKMAVLVERGKYIGKNEDELDVMAFKFTNQCEDISIDIMHDIYPEDSVIPVKERIQYFKEYVVPEVKKVTYSALKECQKLHDQACKDIDEKTVAYHNKVDEIYGVNKNDTEEK